MRQNNAVGDGRGPTLSRMVVAGCFLILSVVVVVLIIRGYYLAMNDQLPSNLTCFRQSVDAVQRVRVVRVPRGRAFSWLLFGSCRSW